MNMFSSLTYSVEDPAELHILLQSMLELLEIAEECPEHHYNRYQKTFKVTGTPVQLAKWTKVLNRNQRNFAL